MGVGVGMGIKSLCFEGFEPGSGKKAVNLINLRTNATRVIGRVLYQSTTSCLGRALWEFRKLGWQCQGGWWQWAMPRTGVKVHLVHAANEYVEHLFRESHREAHLPSDLD